MRERLIDGYFRFSPNSGNGSWFQPSDIPFHVEQHLEAILVKLKCSEQTMNRPLALNFFGVTERKLSISRPLFAGDQCREILATGFDEFTTALDNTAAHNAARTRRKQQLLNSFSQIKIHLFFSTKTSTLHTEKISHVFSVLVVTMTSVNPILLSNSDFSNSSNGGRFEREVTVIFIGLLFEILP